MGGVIAASRVLGPLGFERIFRAVDVKSTGDLPPSAAPRSSENMRAVLITKKALTASIWRLKFDLQEPVRFAPGQFVLLRVAPFEWRNYSIARAEGKRFELLVSTRTGGDGSIYAGNVQPGEEKEVELPFGSYQLQRNSHRRVFVATGTGIAPFLPMFAALQASGELNSAELLFGCSYAEDDITHGGHFEPLPRTTVCVSRDPTVEDSF